MKPAITLAACVLLNLSLTPTPGIAASACSGMVISPIPHSDSRLVCEAVSTTLALMHAYGLEPPPRLEIEVSDAIHAQHDIRRFGQYDPFEGRITVMSQAACLHTERYRKPFGLPMNEALYRSIIAHEVAHAVAEWNFEVADPGLAAHEYLAYVFQIASMPQPQQAALLEHIGVSAFQNPAEITEIYYSLNPDYFALKAFRHFQQTEDRIGMIRRLLSGELIP